MPPSAWPLIPLAEKWGIGDDYEREQAVGQASRGELEDLVNTLNSADDDFWTWLAGPESRGPSFSREYIVMTALTEAFETAKLKLARRFANPS